MDKRKGTGTELLKGGGGEVRVVGVDTDVEAGN